MNQTKELQLLEKCPICESTNLENYLTSKDFTFSKEEFSVQKCGDCGFRFTNPIPREDEIGRYYGADNYMSHATQNTKGLMPFVYKRVRNMNLNRKLRLVRKYSKGKSLLDIGAGNGFFLNACRSEGYAVQGIEPDERARDVAKKDFDLELKTPESLPQLDSNAVDVITMWHVLEHVYHLKRDIKEYLRILKDDGALILALPNIDSYDSNYYGEYWDGLDLPLHLYHFTPKDVSNLFNQFGYEVVEMRPMKFDAYWVSMNSEKFKGGSLPKAFYVGLKSNLKADNGKYSSQMYVIRKKGA
ncbi:MAG: class I SAM-dependent methyltransferase [Crocinitomicaceae bacterium]|nr:class I SAM-dependent methyltransferase [Crocinitomicaceae bacterium]